MKRRFLVLPAFAALLVLTACGSRENRNDHTADDRTAVTENRANDRNDRNNGNGIVDDAKDMVSDVVDDGMDVVSDVAKGGKRIASDVADGARDMVDGAEDDNDGKYRTDEDGKIASDTNKNR